jgi:C4-dicarboxylate transporter DctQ subunit
MRFGFFHRIVNLLVRAGGVVGALLLSIVTLITFYEVIMRYIFKSPTTWSLDYCIYLVMWGTFLGAAYTLREGGHISVDVVIKRLSKKKRTRIRVINYVAVLLFCGILTWRSVISCMEAYQYNEVTLSYTRTPLYVPMLSIAVGAGLLTLEVISDLLKHLRPTGN